MQIKQWLQYVTAQSSEQARFKKTMPPSVSKAMWSEKLNSCFWFIFLNRMLFSNHSKRWYFLDSKPFTSHKSHLVQFLNRSKKESVMLGIYLSDCWWTPNLIFNLIFLMNRWWDKYFRPETILLSFEFHQLIHAFSFRWCKQAKDKML